MSAPGPQNFKRRVGGGQVWLSQSSGDARDTLASLSVREIEPEVLPTEEAIGRAMLEEMERAARERGGDLVVILLSFVRDFERLLGPAFFEKVKSFTPMRTDAGDLEGELTRYVERLDALGGIDLFFIGLGPEANGASHLAYIKPGSGANAADVAGLIPISSSILEHHISKFRAGGSTAGADDEAECRAATHILTLGPAAILRARRVVQSIVDASTAPAKRACYRRVRETQFAASSEERAAQLDQNPGLWTRLHPNFRSLALPDLLEA
jgi:hypothetical protein